MCLHRSLGDRVGNAQFQPQGGFIDVLTLELNRKQRVGVRKMGEGEAAFQERDQHEHRPEGMELDAGLWGCGKGVMRVPGRTDSAAGMEEGCVGRGGQTPRAV